MVAQVRIVPVLKIHPLFGFRRMARNRMPKLFIDASIRIRQVEVHLVRRCTQGHGILGSKDSARSLAHMAAHTEFSPVFPSFHRSKRGER
jgi:hypothetical protein